MANITLDIDALQATFESLRANALFTVLLAALYSFLASAAFIAIHSLLSVGLRASANKLNLVAVSVMFSLTTLYAIVRILQLWSQFDLLADTFDISVAAFGGTLETVVFAINVIIGDAIILWRAIVIWSWQKRIVYPSILLLCATLVLWVVGNVYDLAIEIPASLATSLWATVLVSIKAWQRRRMLQRKVAIMSRRDALENLFNILTESGIVFTLLWVVCLVAFEFFSTDENFDDTMTIVMIVATPLYPTIVVILVAKHKTPISNQLTTIEPVTIMDPDNCDLLAGECESGKETFRP
ncbi:unnamed protein product [Peniophora sp. CBMAI 1063]|nr:unnamed protein product [Peniophora sp. CBMAI 1063]